MWAEAHAKVNLSLLVEPPGPDGYHPLRSLAVSVDWSDRLELLRAAKDEFIVHGAAPPGADNLAWQALAAAREAAGAAAPMRLGLEKHIASAAGLGGGSADAAAALLLADARYDAGLDLAAIGAELGSDVPFCLTGGFAAVSGRGERVEAMRLGADFALGIVVPPAELPTPEVYAAWDRLDGPSGPEVTTALPPSLRAMAPLRNDLYPAAAQLAPAVDEWRAELEARWGRPVAMSGSGGALFAYFLDRGEAAAALDEIPVGARATAAVLPTLQGVNVHGGTMPDPPWGVV